MQEARKTTYARCLELEQQIAALQSQFERLKAEVAELTKQLEAKSRAGKRQAASFRGRKKKGGEKKKPGRKPGHAPESRPDPTPEQIDRTLEAPVDVCPQCRTALGDIVTHVQFQTDIPPVQPSITQFNVQVGFCPCRRGLNFVDWVIDFLQGAGPKYVPPDLLPPGFETQILLTGQ